MISEHSFHNQYGTCIYFGVMNENEASNGYRGYSVKVKTVNLTIKCNRCSNVKLVHWGMFSQGKKYKST